MNDISVLLDLGPLTISNLIEIGQVGQQRLFEIYNLTEISTSGDVSGDVSGKAIL